MLDSPLVRDGKILSGVDFGRLDVLHRRLLEQPGYEHHALIFEAAYEGSLDPARVHHWLAAFCARVIGDLYARCTRSGRLSRISKPVGPLWHERMARLRAEHVGSVSALD